MRLNNVVCVRTESDTRLCSVIDKGHFKMKCKHIAASQVSRAAYDRLFFFQFHHLRRQRVRSIGLRPSAHQIL